MIALIVTALFLESVAVALDLIFGETARETVKFVRHMNHFFNCFNVSSFTKGKSQRNCFLSPYRKDNDFRIEVCLGVKLSALYRHYLEYYFTEY